MKDTMNKLYDLDKLRTEFYEYMKTRRISMQAISREIGLDNYGKTINSFLQGKSMKIKTILKIEYFLDEKRKED